MSAVCGCMENMVRCVLYGASNQTKEATMMGLEPAEREKPLESPAHMGRYNHDPPTLPP